MSRGRGVSQVVDETVLSSSSSSFSVSGDGPVFVWQSILDSHPCAESVLPCESPWSVGMSRHVGDDPLPVSRLVTAMSPWLTKCICLLLLFGLGSSKVWGPGTKVCFSTFTFMWPVTVGMERWADFLKTKKEWGRALPSDTDVYLLLLLLHGSMLSFIPQEENTARGLMGSVCAHGDVSCRSRPSSRFASWVKIQGVVLRWTVRPDRGRLLNLESLSQPPKSSRYPWSSRSAVDVMVWRWRRALAERASGLFGLWDLCLKKSRRPSLVSISTSLSLLLRLNPWLRSTPTHAKRFSSSSLRRRSLAASFTSRSRLSWRITRRETKFKTYFDH